MGLYPSIPGPMKYPHAPRERCPEHGFTLSPEGKCLGCEEAGARRAGAARAILVTAAAVAGLLVVGVAVSRARTHTEGDEPTTSVASAFPIVTERAVPSADPTSQSSADPPQGSTTSPETHAVLSAWQAELAEAEAKRAKELAEVETARAAAEKKQIEDAYKLPAKLESSRPERQHGRVLTFPSEYGDHSWLEESESRHASRDSLPEVTDALTMAPPAGEFLVVPVHVFLLHSDSYPAISASPDLATSVPHIVERANLILAAAGISLALAEVTVAEADNSGFEWSGSTTSASEERPDSHRVGHAIPAGTRGTDGFRVYFIHDFTCNGVYYGHGDAIVRELSRSRGVAGGSDESMPRVLAHEISHGLGLGHVRTATHLMASGTAGIQLSFAEAQRLRSVAPAWPGVHGVDPTNPPAAVLAGRALEGQGIDTGATQSRHATR